MENKLIKVMFNLHNHPVVGMNFHEFTIGYEYDSHIPGASVRKCIEMKYVEEKDHVEVMFNDDTFDRIRNYSHLVYASEYVYNRILGEDILEEPKKEK